jgi:hypothetical protein
MSSVQFISWRLISLVLGVSGTGQVPEQGGLNGSNWPDVVNILEGFWASIPVILFSLGSNKVKESNRFESYLSNPHLR